MIRWFYAIFRLMNFRNCSFYVCCRRRYRFSLFASMEDDIIRVCMTDVWHVLRLFDLYFQLSRSLTFSYTLVEMKRTDTE